MTSYIYPPVEPTEHEKLVALLDQWALMTHHVDRKSLQWLAWFLGENGQAEACEAIMKHAREPQLYGGMYYGVGA